MWGVAADIDAPDFSGAPDIPPRRSDDIAAEFQAVGTTGKIFYHTIR